MEVSIENLKRVLEFVQANYTDGKLTIKTRFIESLISIAADGKRKESTPVAIGGWLNTTAITFVSTVRFIAPGMKLWGSLVELAEYGNEIRKETIATLEKLPGNEDAVRDLQAKLAEDTLTIESKKEMINHFASDDFWKGKDALAGFIIGGVFYGWYENRGLFAADAHCDDAAMIDITNIRVVSDDELLGAIALLPNAFVAKYIASEFPCESLRVRKESPEMVSISSGGLHVKVPERSIQLYCDPFFHQCHSIDLKDGLSAEVLEYIKELLEKGCAYMVGSPKFATAEEYIGLIRSLQTLGIAIGEEDDGVSPTGSSHNSDSDDDVICTATAHSSDNDDKDSVNEPHDMTNSSCVIP